MLRDNIFTCYASFLTDVLLNGQYRKCDSFIRNSIDKQYLLYLGMGKGCSINEQFPLEQFIQQTEIYISLHGIENIARQFKAMANEDEIRFCKTNLMNFGNICRMQMGCQTSMQHTLLILNSIENKSILEKNTHNEHQKYLDEVREQNERIRKANNTMIWNHRRNDILRNDKEYQKTLRRYKNFLYSFWTVLILSIFLLFAGLNFVLIFLPTLCPILLLCVFANKPNSHQERIKNEFITNNRNL